MAARILPMCRCPVGLGAKRVRTFMGNGVMECGRVGKEKERPVRSFRSGPTRRAGLAIAKFRRPAYDAGQKQTCTGRCRMIRRLAVVSLVLLSTVCARAGVRILFAATNESADGTFELY